MRIMQKYAELNRKTMIDMVLKATGLTAIDSFETVHNYIDFDRMVLRKGAVSAEKDKLLLIPMNMRDGSLLCVGKGNSDWNYSAPHGAGRLMSRSEAKKKLDLEEFQEQMKDVYSTSVMESTIDEAPGAYKPIEDIMRLVEDTVDIIDVLKPIYNFKAH
jgi:RNA-splicing ligase RtcB